MEAPQNRRFYFEVQSSSPFGPPIIGERRTTFGKAHGIKVSAHLCTHQCTLSLHWLHEISLSKTVGNHFWPGLMPLAKSWATTILLTAVHHPKQCSQGSSLLLMGGDAVMPPSSMGQNDLQILQCRPTNHRDCVALLIGRWCSQLPNRTFNSKFLVGMT